MKIYRSASIKTMCAKMKTTGTNINTKENTKKNAAVSHTTNCTTDNCSSNCIVCGSSAYCIRNLDNGYDIFKCTNCRLEFTLPMPTKAQLNGFYSNYKDPRAAIDVVRINAQRNIETLQTAFGLNKQQRLLDYGSGQAAFCSVAQSNNWYNYDKYTNDCNADVLTAASYNWVTLWGVLEHVTNPRELIAQLAELLKQKGFIALTTVSTETGIPFQYKPPEHLTYWSKAAIEYIMAAAGMTVCYFKQYKMVQYSNVYLNAVLRTVPDELRDKITHKLPEMVEVPTNEILVVAQRKNGVKSCFFNNEEH